MASVHADEMYRKNFICFAPDNSIRNFTREEKISSFRKQKGKYK